MSPGLVQYVWMFFMWERMCVCPLCTEPICLVAEHSLGKCVQGKNSHTAQRSNYEHPLGEGEGGRIRWSELNKRGDNRGLSISGGGMMVSLPLTSPFSLPPRLTTNRNASTRMEQERNSRGEKQVHSFRNLICDSEAVYKAYC